MDDGMDFPEAAIGADSARPPLRFRRFGGGYRRDDVERLLAEIRLTLQALEVEFGTLRQRASELELQLRESRLELDLFRERGLELAQATTKSRMQAEKIERDANAQAAEIVAAAELEAERRLGELRIEEAARRGELEELARARDDLVARVQESLRELDEAFEDEVMDPGLDPPAGLGTDPGHDGGLSPPAPEIAADDGAELRSASSGPPGLPPDDSLFTDHVELDAGPFADFDSLSDFERALARLPNVDDVHVRRRDGRRAVIALRLTERAPLVAEMREHLSYSVSIRGRDGAHVIMDVEAAAGAV
jgi:hypothetical protein